MTTAPAAPAAPTTKKRKAPSKNIRFTITGTTDVENQDRLKNIGIALAEFSAVEKFEAKLPRQTVSF